jgi:hypothetical protein
MNKPIRLSQLAAAMTKAHIGERGSRRRKKLIWIARNPLKRIDSDE